MHYTRVLGTVGLIGATVLGAMGPSAVSHAASANTTSTTRSSGSGTSVVTAVQRYYQALSTGYVHTSSGGLGTPLSEQYRQESHISGGLSSTVNGRVGAASAAHSSALAAATQPNLSGSTRTNQDFGFYNTGNGVLYHNNESVATDPNDALHVVVAGADTRLGSDSSIFVYSSGSAANARGNACLSNPTSTSFDINLSVAPCGLIDTLGGPGIYDSIDGAKSFTDLIIPDALSGAVPDAIITDSTAYGKVGTTAAFVFGNPYPGGTFTPGVPVTGFATVGSNVAIAGNTSIADTNTVANGGPFVSARAAIGCIAGGGGANGIVGGVGGVGSVNQFNQPGFPNGCLPYDSVGNQTVAFDRSGNLYSVSLGLITSNPIVGAGAGGVTGLPQTDVLLNVSPAIQPIGQLGGAPSNGAAYVQTAPPYAAGRVFNATPPYNPGFANGIAGVAALGCDPTQSSTTVCLHNEVIATNTASNMVNGGGATSDAAARQVGRNFRADATGAAVDAGAGRCGTVHFCTIDTPALAIDNVVDPAAFVTYTVVDFNGSAASGFLPSSNIYLSTATVQDAPGTAYPGDPGYSGGTLPKWNPPVLVDNSRNNPFCFGVGAGAFAAIGDCSSSYGASTAIGPDGSAYIAYLNDDPGNGNFFTSPPATTPGQTALLVAEVGPNLIGVGNTALAALVVNHDAFNAATGAQPGNPAGLDPASGAYFTIANRPTIAVSGATTVGGKFYPGGLVIVAWTDQRSLANGALSTTRGTRVWYTVGAARSAQPLGFTVINGTPVNLVGTYPIPATSSVSVVDTAIVGATTTGTVAGRAYGGGPGAGQYNIAEVYEPSPAISPANPLGFVNQFFPAIVADQSTAAPISGIASNVFVGFYQETPGTVAFAGGDNLFSSTASLAFLVGKSTDFANTFGIQQANVLMPLPNPPLSPAYCSYQYGFKYGTSYVRPGVGPAPGVPFASNGAAASACNAVPYFGNGIGASAGSTDTASNDAYFAFTNTQADSRDFNVQGSQNIYTLHAS